MHDATPRHCPFWCTDHRVHEKLFDGDDDDSEHRWFLPDAQGPSANIYISQDVEGRDGPPGLNWDSEAHLASFEESRVYGRDLVLASAVLEVIVNPIETWSWDIRLLQDVARSLGFSSGASLIGRFERA